MELETRIGENACFAKNSISIGENARAVEDGEIVFKSKQSIELRIKSNGELFINGELKFTDKEIHQAFKKFITG